MVAHTPEGDLSWLAEKVGTLDVHFSLPGPGFTMPDDFELPAQAGRVVEPVDVPTAATAAHASTAGPVIALIGWPTGRHHSLVKAAEARLAVEQGASEVWLALDCALLAKLSADSAADSAGGPNSNTGNSGAGNSDAHNELLSDIIAVTQAVPEPAKMGIVCPADLGAGRIRLLADIAGRAGVERIAIYYIDANDTNDSDPAAGSDPALAPVQLLEQLGTAPNRTLPKISVAGGVGSLDELVDTLSAGAKRAFLRRG